MKLRPIAVCIVRAAFDSLVNIAGIVQGDNFLRKLPLSIAHSV